MGALSSILGYFGYGSAYDGANSSTSRKDRAYTRSKTTDEDRNVGAWGREKLRLECWDSFRNNAITYGLVTRVADYVVGPDGLLPQAKTSDPQWNKDAEAFFSEWSKVADYRGRIDFRQMQLQDIVALFTDGESGGVFTDGGQIQQIEAGRIATPNDLISDKKILEGVKLSDTGRPVAFYVLARGENGYTDAKNFEKVNAQDFVHFLDPYRTDQVRGVPYLAPLINQMRDYDDLSKSLLEKARLDARYGWVITTAAGQRAANNLGPRRSSAESETGNDVQTYEKFDNARNYYVKPGEDVKSLASATPNPQYVEFCNHHLTAIAAGAGLPREFLMLDFTGGSFSQSRAALMIAYRRFASLQTLLEKKCQRIWNWRIAKAIKAGDLPPAPVNSRTGFSEWYKVEWSRPRYDWIDPEAQVSAEKAALALGTESHTSISKKYGRDSEDILNEKARDIANAKRIATENGLSDWRDLLDWSSNPQRTISNIPDEKKDQPELEGLAKWQTQTD